MKTINHSRAATPHSVEHHYAPLAIIEVAHNETISVTHDLRRKFSPASSTCRMTLEHFDALLAFVVILAGVSLLVTILVQMVGTFWTAREQPALGP